jgi:hypothetical protein
LAATVIGVTKIVIHRDGFDDALDSLLAKSEKP